MNPTPERRCSIVWPVAWAFLFMGVLWLMDFPKPMVDDLFYCGAGFNLANGGDFSNPLLDRVEFPSHFFFEYPPLHSYVVYAWAKVMGLSAMSMTGMVIILYFITAVSVIVILRKYGAPCWLSMLVPFGVVTGLMPSGLRPEALGVGLAMAGFAIFECGCRQVPVVFIAFLLMFAGGSAAPRITPSVAALVLLGVFRLWREFAEAREKRWRFCAAVGAAFALSVLIFLVQIKFRVREFWTTFHFTAVKIVGGSKLTLALIYLKTAWISGWQWPLMLLAAGFFVAALRRPGNELTRTAIVLAGAFPVAMFLGVVGFGTSWWIIFILFLTMASVLREAAVPLPGKCALQAALLAAFLVANKQNVIDLVAILGGKIQDSGTQTEALKLQSKPGHVLLLDQDVARYLYGYKLPAGSIDWGTTMLFPGSYFDVHLWQRGDVFVVCPAAVDLLRHFTMLDEPPPPTWAPLGRLRPRWKTYTQPGEAFIIPVEKCRDVRPEFVKPGSASTAEIFKPSP